MSSNDSETGTVADSEVCTASRGQYSNSYSEPVELVSVTLVSTRTGAGRSSETENNPDWTTARIRLTELFSGAREESSEIDSTFFYEDGAWKLCIPPSRDE